MIAKLAKQLESLVPATPAACFAALTGATALYFPVVASIAFLRTGWPGVIASILAASVCWVGGMLALAVVIVLREPKHGVTGPLMGMLIRVGVPLVAGISLSRQGGSLNEAGVFGLIVAFYLFTLAVETWLSVSLVGRYARSQKAPAV